MAAAGATSTRMVLPITAWSYPQCAPAQCRKSTMLQAALLCALVSATATVPGVAVAATAAFNGEFIEGEGDTRYLGLLDAARRQLSQREYEYESVLSLYDGSLDGMLEGPSWNAWWTQNSYGPTMAALPLMDAVTWHGVQHSMAWWYDSMGNGTKVDGKWHTTRTAHGEVPAPDGCLCDAALPW